LIHEVNVLSNLENENENENDDSDEESIESNKTKYININNTLSNSLDNTNENDENKSPDIFKQLNISSLQIEEEILDKNNYKNLSIQKLRSIIIQKGLSNDASKLKKNDILKMLESE